MIMGANASRAAISSSIKSCTLWKADRSPACRAVMMALDAMDLSITEIDVNMDQCEHKTPELTAMNPKQTLPIFRDRELVLSDSHSICGYLASRYCPSGPASRVYPSDPGGRALVNQLLNYNCGVLYPRYRAAADPILYENCNFVMPQQMCNIECAYADLENMLRGRDWFGGSLPTLGDICIGATLSTLDTLIPVDSKRYPRLSTWLSRLSEQGFYITGNKKGLNDFVQRIVLIVIKMNSSVLEVLTEEDFSQLRTKDNLKLFK